MDGDSNLTEVATPALAFSVPVSFRDRSALCRARPVPPRRAGAEP